MPATESDLNISVLVGPANRIVSNQYIRHTSKTVIVWTSSSRAHGSVDFEIPRTSKSSKTCLKTRPRTREETKREGKRRDSVFGVVLDALGAKSRLPGGIAEIPGGVTGGGSGLRAYV